MRGLILTVMLAAPAQALVGCGPEPGAVAQSSIPPQPRREPLPSPPEPAVPAARDDSPWTPDAPLFDWEYIVLHHTATTVGDVESINREHQKRKDSRGAAWRGIAYHFLIGNGRGMQDGEVAATFRWQEQSEGAHAGSLKHNQKGIGICLVGDFNKSAPTKKQLASLKSLLAWLEAATGIPRERILRHSDIRSTACPGKKFKLP